MNRYNYTLNDPINLTDPSGHCSTYINGSQCVGNGSITTVTQTNNVPTWNELGRFGITLSGNWTSTYQFAVWAAAVRVGSRLAQAKGGTTVGAFRKAYSGGVNITFGSANKQTDSSGNITDLNHPGALGDCAAVSAAGCTTSPTQIDFWSMAGDNDKFGNELTRDIYNVVHEFGHAYDKGNGLPSSNLLPQGYFNNRDYVLRPNGIDNYPTNGSFTPYGSYWNIQQDPAIHANNEMYADMYVAWVFNAWNTDPVNHDSVLTAQGYMPH